MVRDSARRSWLCVFSDREYSCYVNRWLRLQLTQLRSMNAVQRFFFFCPFSQMKLVSHLLYLPDLKNLALIPSANHLTGKIMLPGVELWHWTARNSSNSKKLRCLLRIQLIHGYRPTFQCRFSYFGGSWKGDPKTSVWIIHHFW